MSNPVAGIQQRRMRMLLLALVGLLVMLLVVLAVRLPFLVLTPGPVFNTIGEYEDEPLISITGTKTYPDTGQLDMSTVNQYGGLYGGLTTRTAIEQWLLWEHRLLPTAALYSEDSSAQEEEAKNTAQMVSSQYSAVLAALNYLEIPYEYGFSVMDVTEGSPADGVLEPGDALLKLDGVPIKDLESTLSRTHGEPAGTEFTLTIQREGETEPREVTLATAYSEDAGLPLLGIVIGTDIEPGFDIEFTLGDVGGASAGLMFTLGLIDLLTPESLTGGSHIAGTGTMNADGEVGPIGGIAQKLVGTHANGAELFLAPASNCPDVVGRVPEGLTVTAVSSLPEALDALQSWRDGRPETLRTCEDVLATTNTEAANS